MSVTTGTAADYRDLLDKLDAFLTEQGHAFAKVFEGEGDGDIVGYIGTADTVTETITVEFTSATEFDVTGSVSGALPSGEVDTPYTSDVIEFTVEAGDVPFTAGDTFTLSMTPPWARSRAAGCPDTTKWTTNLSNIDNLFDDNQNTYADRAATSAYIEFEMQSATEVSEFVLQAYDNSYSPRDFALEYRDDTGDPWTEAQAWTSQTWASSQARTYTLSSAPGAHKYWRLNITAGNGASLRLVQLTLHEKPGDMYNLATRFEVMWVAPGLDGEQSIYIGARTYGHAGTDVFNLSFSMYRAENLAESVDNQPNGSATHALCLVNSPIRYWIIANGQRFILVATHSSLYQFAYAGYGMPYEMPAAHPYPAIVAASSGVLTMRYDSVQGRYRFPADPGTNAMHAFYPDGQWRAHSNRANSTNTEGTQDTSTQGKVWPAEMRQSNRTASSLQPSNIRENLDGTSPLVPCVLYFYGTPNHVWGEFDGVYWTSGFATVPEAIVREAGFDHLVVNNIFRSGFQHFAALRLD